MNSIRKVGVHIASDSLLLMRTRSADQTAHCDAVSQIDLSYIMNRVLGPAVTQIPSPQ
ncbi:unnamed protein product [Mycena citricolor]|uniref:Uncharacterized protein n=1 Tax=Mycena citricolor TaxID=2018698 RepID=A0AAD2HVH9_9AGAR|nr:unnamed protein product [Mycena citricolor]